ncbi:hypothetical protein ALC60_04801 [Trachymyrmex zeteki]|nr:hypothetical protein ALC60_04801 [Trachymyrmex zeteki]
MGDSSYLIGGRHLLANSSLTSPYNPQSNPVERVMREIGRAIRAYSSNKQTTWDRLLVRLENVINATEHASTGFTPDELHLDVKRVVDINPALLPLEENDIEKANKIEIARHSLEIAARKRKAQQDKRQIARDYEIGDLVWIKMHRRSEASRKLTKKIHILFDGPYQIVHVVRRNAYVIADLDDNEIGVYNSRQIRPHREAQYRPTQEELEDDNEDSTRPQGETQNDEERQSEENFESIEEDLEDYDEDPTKPQGGPHNNGERHSEEDFENNEDVEYAQQEAEIYEEQYSENESEEHYTDNERYEDEHSLPDQEREDSSEDEEYINNIRINTITISDSDEEISSDIDSEDTILMESQWKREERGKTLKTTLKSEEDNNGVDREIKQPDNNNFESTGMSNLPIKKEDHSEEKTAQDQYVITERIFSQSQDEVKTEVTSIEEEENLRQKDEESQDTSKEYEQEHQPENYNETYVIDQSEVRKIENSPELTNRRRNERKAVINIKSILRKSNTRQSAEKCTKRLKDYFINPEDTTDKSNKEERRISSEEGYKTNGKKLQKEEKKPFPETL